MTVEGCTLPPEGASVAAARRHVERVLDGWGVEGTGWVCLQLISELATNAVLHARTPFTVELSRDHDVIRVCVQDGSPVRPGVRRYADDSTTGRGLRLVESMATDWGVERAGSGKTVWFEVHAVDRSTAHAWDDGDEVDLDALLSRYAVEDL